MIRENTLLDFEYLLKMVVPDKVSALIHTYTRIHAYNIQNIVYISMFCIIHIKYSSTKVVYMYISSI